MSGILFDGRWIRAGMTGVGICAFNTLAAFAKRGERMGLILNPGPVPAELAAGFEIHRTRIDLTHHPMTELFEQILIPYLCYRHGYDRFVSFENRVPAFHPRIRTFAYIHDLAFLKAWGSHHLKYSVFLMANLLICRLFATRIVTVSHAVERDLMDILRFPRRKIHVVHSADTGLHRFPEKAVAGLRKPFLLAVGMNNPRKNLPCLLEGFRIFRQGRPEFSLVLTGNREWIDSASAALPREGVISLGFVSEGELRHLYRNAWCLAYPSKDEGFGIPLMDAYVNGCPVFCSDIPVFREVMGGYARYFDPSSPEDMAAKLAEGPPQPPGSIGLASDYSWDATAAALSEKFGDPKA